MSERKRVIIEGKIYDPILDCGHAGMDIETKEFADTSIQDVLLLFENKRVRVTIEEILEEVPSGRSPTYDERGMPRMKETTK